MKKLEQHELNATLKLLLISVVILPILPDQNYGPWAAFNPYHIWWMVVLIAGISYLGYFADQDCRQSAWTDFNRCTGRIGIFHSRYS